MRAYHHRLHKQPDPADGTPTLPPVLAASGALVCPRDGGPLLDELGDSVCLSCGYRYLGNVKSFAVDRIAQ